MSLRLDPRTKLYMVFIVSAIVMMTVTTPFLWGVRIVMTMVPILLLVIEKRYASAFRFLVLYIVALALTFFYLSEESTGVLEAILTGYCGIIAQFLPAMITAWYMIRTTKIDEFMSAMQKLRVPDGIGISLAVVMRYFPTIKEEYASIRDAMRMRALTFGRGSIVKMVEYRMIPLLFSCVNIGDELSAAALTRGLGSKVKRTSIIELRFGVMDYLLILFFTLTTAIFIGFKYFK